MGNIRQGINTALGIATAPAKAVVNVVGDVAGGVKDYVKDNNRVHADALKKTGAKQNAMISEINRTGGNSPTPMGVESFYGTASAEAKKMKKEQGISVTSSIKKRLANPKDNAIK